MLQIAKDVHTSPARVIRELAADLAGNGSRMAEVDILLPAIGRSIPAN